MSTSDRRSWFVSLGHELLHPLELPAIAPIRPRFGRYGRATRAKLCSRFSATRDAVGRFNVELCCVARTTAPLCNCGDDDGLFAEAAFDDKFESWTDFAGWLHALPSA